MTAKILAFDVETAPSVGYHWGRYDQNIPQSMIIEEGSLLCWAACWVDKPKELISDAVWDYTSDMRDDYMIAESLSDLVSQADFAIAHNAKFDTGWLTRSLIKNCLPPVRMPRIIDTLKIARSEFKMPSNRLGDLAQFLGLEAKADPGGFQTWRDILEGEEEVQEAAQDRMMKYCVQDVSVLLNVYNALKPFWRAHPNLGAFQDAPTCPTCQSNDVTQNGYYRSNAGKYRRYRCRSCGSQAIRGKENLRTTESRKASLVNAR